MSSPSGPPVSGSVPRVRAKALGYGLSAFGVRGAGLKVPILLRPRSSTPEGVRPSGELFRLCPLLARPSVQPRFDLPFSRPSASTSSKTRSGRGRGVGAAAGTNGLSEPEATSPSSPGGKTAEVRRVLLREAKRGREDAVGGEGPRGGGGCGWPARVGSLPRSYAQDCPRGAASADGRDLRLGREIGDEARAGPRWGHRRARVRAGSRRSRRPPFPVSPVARLFRPTKRQRVKAHRKE